MAAKRKRRSYSHRTKAQVTDDGWGFVKIPVAVADALGQPKKDIDVRVDMGGQAFHSVLRHVRDHNPYEPGVLPVIHYTMLLYKDMIVRLNLRPGQMLSMTFVNEKHPLMRRGRVIMPGGKYDKRR